MSRYIDADNLPRHGKRGGVVYWRDIEAQPTVNVVEVVKCKDCKRRPIDTQEEGTGFDYEFPEEYGCPWGIIHNDSRTISIVHGERGQRNDIR